MKGWGMTMIKEHERVVLTVDFPEYGLRAGNVGVVVMVHGEGEGYEVEVFTPDGKTLDVITVEAGQVRPVAPTEVMHTRRVA
jgi:hypothetical protein